MASEPKAMKEIHDIRLQIYEETKNMTAEQRIANTQKAVEEFVTDKRGRTLRLNCSPYQQQ